MANSLESRLRRFTGGAFVLAIVSVSFAFLVGVGELAPSYLRAHGVASRTVREVLDDVGPRVDRALGARSEAAGVPWPPSRTTWLAFKQERRLEAWVAGPRGEFVRVGTYPILAASGVRGPKRREGDRQVPEGFYRLTALNPNSRFHLSVRVDYPNDEDVAHRQVDRRAMGGDIFVHGSRFSVGCLAVGDDAIEELFVLAARVPARGRRILIAPVDFRAHPGAATDDDPWVAGLYGRLRRALEGFPAGRDDGPEVAPGRRGP